MEEPHTGGLDPIGQSKNEKNWRLNIATAA